MIAEGASLAILEGAMEDISTVCATQTAIKGTQFFQSLRGRFAHKGSLVSKNILQRLPGPGIADFAKDARDSLKGILFTRQHMVY